jgi:hypothetical protein
LPENTASQYAERAEDRVRERVFFPLESVGTAIHSNTLSDDIRDKLNLYGPEGAILERYQNKDCRTVGNVIRRTASTPVARVIYDEDEDTGLTNGGLVSN